MAHLATFVAAIGLSLLGAALAEAGEQDRDRWRPGASLMAGARVIPVDEASISSLRGDFDGEGNRVYGLLGFALELRSPAVADSLYAPRIFARGGVAALFDQEDRVVNDGAPGPLVVPFIDNDNDGVRDFDAGLATVSGQGSGSGAKTVSPSFSAGLGLDFEFEAGDRVVHIRPSVEWIWERERVKAVVGLAESTGANPAACSPECRTAFGSADQVEDFHLVGPGFEVEVESGRVGPFMSSVFVQTQAFYVTDRKASVQGFATWDDGSGSEAFAGRYERGRWDYRFGFGFRMDWLPE